MSDFYTKFGNKTVEELPVQVTNLQTTGGSSSVGEVAVTWTNNNTIAGCTNVLQVSDGSNWTDNVEVASGETSSLFTGLTTAQTYNLRIAVKEASTGRYYPSITTSEIVESPYPTSGLIGRWQFEGNNNDSEGLNNAINGANSYTTGIVGQCVSNSGSQQDHASLITRAAIRYTHSYSLSFWHKSSNTYITNRVLVAVDSTPWMITTGGLNTITFCKRDGTAYSSRTLNTDEWTHFGLSFDGTGTSWYRNGAFQFKITETTDIGAINTLYFVENFGSLVGTLYFDQIYLYDRDIDATEMAKLYNGGAGI